MIECDWCNTQYSHSVNPDNVGTMLADVMRADGGTYCSVSHLKQSLKEKGLWRPFQDCQVTDISTVREFVEKYYRHDRLRGRGDDYAELVIASHEAHLEKYGYDIISRHESRTGELVSFYLQEEQK